MAGINDVAKLVKVSREDVGKVFDALKSLLVEGEMVTIKGFGTFRTKVRKARTYKTPLKDVGSFEVGDRRAVVFKAVHELRFLPKKKLTAKTKVRFPTAPEGESNPSDAEE